MTVIADTGTPLCAHSGNASSSNPDLWIRRNAVSQSGISFGLGLVHSTHVSGKRLEATVMVGLADKSILFCNVDFSGPGLPDLVGKIAEFLGQIDWQELPEAILAVQIEDRLGCHIEILREHPENLSLWCLTRWRQRRLVEAAQTEHRLSLANLKLQADTEAELLAEQLKTEISEIRQLFLDLPGDIESKLPDLSWVELHNYLSPPNPEVARNRSQAICLFPLLTSLAMNRKSATGFAEDLGKTIDRGDPLIDFVRNRWGVRAVAVKAIRGLGFEDIGEEWRQSIRPLLSILSEIAPERFPRTKEQWHVFGEQARLMSALTKTHIGSDSIRAMMANASRKLWRASHQMPVEIIEQVRVLDSFSGQLLRALKVWVLVENKLSGRGYSDGDFHQVVFTALMAFGLERSIRLALSWRAIYAEDVLQCHSDKSSFPVLLEIPVIYEGLQIVQLKTPMDLEFESAAMNHCVDSYVAACKSGRSVIFSTRTAAGQPLSTFELAIQNKRLASYEINLVQHKGTGNRPPPGNAVDAMRYFIRHLKGEEGSNSLIKFSREKLLLNLDARLASDHRMAVIMRDFVTQKTGGRIDFEKMLSNSGKKEDR